MSMPALPGPPAVVLAKVTLRLDKIAAVPAVRDVYRRLQLDLEGWEACP